MVRVDGHMLPYAWNHTVTYEPKLGRMPYLVQRLKADDLFVEFDVSEQILRYQLTTSVSKGLRKPFNRPVNVIFING